MKNMFVYGSLKKGFFNHSFIEENPRNKLIRKGFVVGYKLYLLCSYPVIKQSSIKDKVYVELYSLTDEVFDRIDIIEKSADFVPVKVEDDIGNSGIIYVYNGEVKGENFISIGNWAKGDEKLKII